mgnify:CR=1 FL=1
MDALLIKTGGLLLIVALGYLLKRRGVFQQGDARLLSRIIVNLTLPGALLSSFSAFRLVSPRQQPPMSCCWLSPPW